MSTYREWVYGVCANSSFSTIMPPSRSIESQVGLKVTLCTYSPLTSPQFLILTSIFPTQLTLIMLLHGNSYKQHHTCSIPTILLASTERGSFLPPSSNTGATIGDQCTCIHYTLPFSQNQYTVYANVIIPPQCPFVSIKYIWPKIYTFSYTTILVYPVPSLPTLTLLLTSFPTRWSKRG